MNRRIQLPSFRGLFLRSLAGGLLASSTACDALRAEAPSTPATQAVLSIAQLAPDVKVDRLRKTLEYLASDELEGRGLKTKGIELAADFIAGRFRDAGLKPLPGTKDYFQTFEMTRADGIDPATSLAVTAGFKGEEKSYALGEDFTATSFSAEKDFEGDVVFVGYGITSKEKGYDDYAGLDVKGKVVVAMRYEPIDSAGKSRFAKEDWSENAHLDNKAKTAIDHGAVALLLVNPPDGHGTGGDALMPFARQYAAAAVTLPVAQVKQAAVEAMLKAGGTDKLAALQKAIDKDAAPASKLLPGVKARGKIALKRTTRVLKNVAGYLPGAGPHADEFIVVGAHYDHLGRGGPGSLDPKSTDIHHGADDNASGTTAVLELADIFGRAAAPAVGVAAEPPSPVAAPPDRSVLFVCFTAEESGLIGSHHFVEKPPVPLEKIAAMLNMDMVGRLREHTLLVGGSGTAAGLDAVLNKADEGFPVKIKDAGKGGLGPSDHMSFALKKVPVLFFFTGLHADYHRPSDTADKINYDGMAEVIELSERVVRGLSEMPREKYVDAADAHSMAMGTGAGGSRVILGVVPEYGEEPTNAGVKISGTTAGTPAALAGLKGGDVIVGIDARKIDRLEDLSQALSGRKPGDKVKIKLLRDKKELSVEATLAERKG